MSAKIIKIDSDNYHIDVLAEGAKILSEGGLVAFPTETVYGLGANSNIHSAVERLYEVKGSPKTRPFTFHLASSDDVYRYIPIIPRLAIRLMKAFWPGPLTLVLPDGQNSWSGFRVPDDFVARDLIRLSKSSVIASSANLVNQQPPTDTQIILKTLGDKIDIIIDSGHSRIGLSSTVIKVTHENKFEILREGSIAKSNIDKFTYRMIVFICSGNTCRSPMAMGLFKKMLADKLRISVREVESKGYKIISAGTSAIYNSPASNTAIEIMKEMGTDIKEHLSQPVTLSMLEEADDIYVMTKGHLITLKEWVPAITGRIKLLDPSGEDITDPIASGKECYRECINKIKKGLELIKVV